MNKLKITTIVGTRPEIIRLSQIIKKLDIHFDHTLIHTGQNYDYSLNQVFFDELGIRKPDFFLNVVGKDLGETIGSIIAKTYSVLKLLMPDAVLILGDTNSGLSSISSKRLHIPVFHMEAGNRCFDERLPEEVNRRIIDTTSDVNLCYSEHARRNLINSGFPYDRVLVTGSPMPEVLAAHFSKIQNSNVMEKLSLSPDNYILLSAHREENIDSDTSFSTLMNTINQIASHYNMPIIYPCHPRSKKKIDKSGVCFHPNVKVIEPLGFYDYNKLQINAYAILSDSGTLPEESTYYFSKGIQLCAISLRSTTERPEAMEKGNFILSGLEYTQVVRSIEALKEQQKTSVFGNLVYDYIDTNVSSKVVNIIHSYIKLVKQNVWKEI